MTVNNKKKDERTDYLINSTFKKRINLFFKEMLPFPLDIEMVILPDQEYSKNIDSTSMAELRTSAEEEKLKTLTGVADKIRNRIHAREVQGRVNLDQIMQEFLKVYYPSAPKSIVDNGAGIFANAYRCYDVLFDKQELKDFFVKLCTEENTIYKRAGFPGKP